jgi:hypothetical protein
MKENGWLLFYGSPYGTLDHIYIYSEAGYKQFRRERMWENWDNQKGPLGILLFMIAGIGAVIWILLSV